VDENVAYSLFQPTKRSAKKWLSEKFALLLQLNYKR